LTAALKEKGYKSTYQNEIKEMRAAWNHQMEFFAKYAYDDNFKPIVEARDPRTVEEFVELTGGTITQTSALCLIRKMIPEDSIIVGASGSLPGCLQRMWTTDTRYSYHMEYGYSCMGYEVAASLGAKIASPNQEVYAMTGDGSYLMLHTELVTSLQEGKKINVLLFDNCGFGCINNLQMSNGIGSLATEFRYRTEDQGLSGGLIPIDFAKAAEGYGVKTYTVKTLAELKAALEDSKKQTRSTLIDIKVLPKTMTEGYKSWWHVGIASTSEKESVNTAYQNKEANLKKARMY